MMKINSDLIRQTKQMMQTLKQGTESATGSAAVSDNEGGVVPSGTAINLEEMSKPVKQAVTLLKDNGYPVTQESLAVIQKFMETANGTTGEKLKALEVLVGKDMPIEGQLLQDLHTGRTGTLVDFLKPNSRPVARNSQSEKSNPSESHFKTASVEGQLVNEAVIEGLEFLMDTIMSMLSTEVGDKTGDSGDNSVKNPSKSVSKVLRNSTIDIEGNQKGTDLHQFDHSMSDGTTINKEQDALENLLKTLESPEVLDALIEALENQFGEVDQSSMGIVPSQSQSEQRLKMVLEERVTPKLLAIRQEFETQKKSIVGSLNRLQPGIEVMPHAEKVQVLAKVTDQLDHLIMKSDVGLYLGIKEEKQLLKQSTVVDQARVALNKGDLAKAEKLIKSIVEVLDKLEFKPTLQKAMALPKFGGSFYDLGADMGFDHLKSDFEDGVMQYSKSEKSVGGLIQYLRRMGMNHETEVFQQTFARQEGSQTEKAPINLKEQLLQLSRSGLSESNQSQAEGSLSHISGQQLNNKLLDKAQTQQMLLSIPLQQQGQVAEMKVFIQTKQEKLKADWKNFDMFFVLSTSQVGEIGIKVRSVDMKLSVDVLNNHVNREALFKPLVELLTQDIEAVGFVVTRVGFKAWGNESPTERNEAPQPVTPKPTNTKDGGFDVKI